MHDVAFLSPDPSIATSAQGVDVKPHRLLIWYGMRLFQSQPSSPLFLTCRLTSHLESYDCILVACQSFGPQYLGLNGQDLRPAHITRPKAIGLERHFTSLPRYRHSGDRRAYLLPLIESPLLRKSSRRSRIPMTPLVLRCQS